MKIRDILYLGAGLLLAACSADSEGPNQPRTGVLTLTSSIVPFEGEAQTRTDLEGRSFVNGDKIKLKIICPFVSAEQIGETTYGNSADGLWLLTWSGGNWVNIEASDGVDVKGTYRPADGYNLFAQYEAQQTPYVYTASTWNENVLFIANGTLYSKYSYIFHADQRDLDDYLKCDLLWAQSYMQTGSYNVHLSFNHVMACLKVTVSGVTLSNKAVLTVEGMPDIDQREVVVGDYYAAASKINSGYGYQQKCSCTYGENGKVLGVAVNDESAGRAVVKKMNGTEITNEGVYTAHRAEGSFYLIVPPCTLSAKPVIWIRDGEQRYSYSLDQLTFEQGKQYRITINIS